MFLIEVNDPDAGWTPYARASTYAIAESQAGNAQAVSGWETRITEEEE